MMMVMQLVPWSTLVVLLSCHLVQATNPGAQVRISQHGIQYAGEVLVKQLSSQVAGQTIPDQSGETHTAVGKVKYEFTDMRVTMFNPPSFSAGLTPGSSVTLTLSGASLAIHGHWRYKIKILFPISDSGSIDVTLKGITITQKVAFGASGGRPSISSAGCSCSIGDVDVDIHTGLDWLYNLFKDKIEHAIKDNLQGTLCKLLVKEINVDAEKALQEMKIVVPVVQDDVLLDYSFLAPPKIGTNYVDALLRGEVYLKGQSPGQSGLTPAPFNDTAPTDHMVYFWLSDFVMDTLGYSLQKNKFLTYNLTKDDLGAKEQHFLNITCDDSTLETKCVGSVVPKLREIAEYANGTIEIGLWSTQVPKLNIVSGALLGNFKGNMAFFVKTPKLAKPAYVFTINVTETFVLKAALHNNLITAQVAKSRVRVDILDSKIGPIQDTGLQWIFNTLNLQFIMDRLNKQGAKGFELPQIKHVAYTNPQFQLMKDTLLVKTDLVYQP